MTKDAETGYNVLVKENVDRLLEDATIVDGTVYDNGTLMSVKLECGYAITVTSECMDPEDYDHEVGLEICREKVYEKLAGLEAYRILQNELDLKRILKDDQKEDDAPESEGEPVSDPEEPGPALRYWKIERALETASDGTSKLVFYPKETEPGSPLLETYDEAEQWIADNGGKRG